MGNSILHGHVTSEISGSTSQSEAEGRMQESERGAMGDSNSWRGGESGDEISERQEYWAARPIRSNDELGQTQPSLGGDSDGATNRMDDAELFVASDNRTDELRLLGNGVVPATAERAFITLMDQLLTQ